MITQKHELYGVEKHMSAIIVENLTFSYPGSYDNIFENTSFQLDTSWKLGLVGRNGRGKTTLCKLLIRSQFRLDSYLYKPLSFLLPTIMNYPLGIV